MTDATAPARHPRRWKIALSAALLCLLALLAAGLTRDPSKLPSALVGQPMPGFALPLLDGEGTLDSAEAAGHPLILNFWASWCTTCRQEHPVLVDLGLRAQVQGNFAIAGINYRDTPERAATFLDREGHFPYLSAQDPNGRLGIDFGVYGMPETFFVDATGIVRARHAGPLTPRVLAEHLPKIGVTP